MKMDTINALIRMVNTAEATGVSEAGTPENRTAEDEAYNAEVNADFENDLNLAKAAIQAELAKKGKRYNKWSKP